MAKRSDVAGDDLSTLKNITITPPSSVATGVTITIDGTKTAGEAVNARVIDINNPSNLIFVAVIQSIGGTTYSVQFTLPSASIYVLVVYSSTSAASITLDAR